MNHLSTTPPSTATARTRRAVVTGATQGLGRALASGLATSGWDLVLTARTATDLHGVARELGARTTVTPVAGDVTDTGHRRDLARVVATLGTVDLVINNASTLGPSPLPRLEHLEPADFGRILDTNVVAPLAIIQVLRPHLAPDVTILNVSSDAAIGAWEGWGGYGASKAALDHVSAVLAVEHPGWHVLAMDPGDLRTAMHQRAFPDEDITDRPLPQTVVAQVLALVDADRPSGRVRIADLPVTESADGTRVNTAATAVPA